MPTATALSPPTHYRRRPAAALPAAATRLQSTLPRCHRHCHAANAVAVLLPSPPPPH
jgi:hypothetical protein